MAQRKTTHRKVMTLDAPGYPRLEIIQHRKTTESGAEIVYALNSRPWSSETRTYRTNQIFKSSSLQECVHTAAHLVQDRF